MYKCKCWVKVSIILHFGAIKKHALFPQLSYTSQVNSALTDFCFAWGELSVTIVMNLEYDNVQKITVQGVGSSVKYQT